MGSFSQENVHLATLAKSNEIVQALALNAMTDRDPRRWSGRRQRYKFRVKINEPH